MTEIFKPLGNMEEPEVGIFFVEAESYPVEDDRTATGIAFAIGVDGLLVTCAHVVLALGELPGSTVTVYCAAPKLPIAVEAEVLEKGWCGPEWQTQMEWAGRSINILELVDQRPDAFQEDIALLRIRPETARWDGARAPIPGSNPIALIKQSVRALPLGAPGYPHGSSVQLKSWHVTWVASSPDMHAGNATFLGVEKRLHGIVRFRSTDIRPGFSGAPLWDPARRRVIGMIRRGIRSAIPDAVLSVDSRVLAQNSGIALQPDAGAAQLLEILAHLAQAFAPLRHFPILQSLVPPKLVDLFVRAARPRDTLEESERDRKSEPAVPTLLEILKSEAVVVLAGGPGSGKSTLLHAIATSLLQDPAFASSGRLVPIFVRAVDFESFGFDIGALLDQHAQSYSLAATGGSLAQSFGLNELTPLLLLDGLDEIDRVSRARVMGRLGGIRSANDATRILVATRPIDDLKLGQDGHTIQGWPIFELQHLASEDIAALSNLWFENPIERERFLDLLNAAAWDRRGPTPLQIATAASVFRSPIGFPDRPVDLPFRLVDHLLYLGEQEAGKQLRIGGRELSRADELYQSHLRTILRCLGRLTVAGATTRVQVVAGLEDHKAEIWAKDVVDLIRFLERESTLLGGVVAIDHNRKDGWELIWSHRTVAEALAAEGIAISNAFKPVEAVGSFQAAQRAQGQSFAITLLAALDGHESGRAAVNLALARTLTAGASDYNATLLAVRALGAGIRTSDDLHRRLVRTLIALLLLPEEARLGPQKCENIFSTDDLPNPLEIARRPLVRRAIIQQLHERWALRDPRRRGEIEPLYVSGREAKLLDRLDMWSDIEIPLARREGADVGRDLARMPGMPRYSRSRNAAEPLLSAALLTHALRRLQDDADGFFAGFAAFARGPGAAFSGEDAARAYIIDLLANRDGTSFGDPS